MIALDFKIIRFPASFLLPSRLVSDAIFGCRFDHVGDIAHDVVLGCCWLVGYWH